MYASQNKKLCLFVSSYPTGYGEPFIETELKCTAHLWQHVFLVRNHDEPGVKRYVPENSTRLCLKAGSYNKWKKPINLLAMVFRILVSEFWNSRQRRMFINHFRQTMSLLVSAISQAERLEQEGLIKTDHVYYSYWFNEWNLVLSVLKYKRKIDSHFTRAHGFDLYEYNGKLNYLPLRHFCMKQTTIVYSVSETGANYLRNLYSRFTEKVKTAYLGTIDHGIGPLVPLDESLVVVSCGSLVKVKRTHLIIEILKNVNGKVKWYHIGEGLLRPELEQLAALLPDNVNWHFFSRLSQEELFYFYKSNYIDCFINTSVSEGLPVSIMEAMSFGIPVLATNVGGTKEIVIDNFTGKLLPVDFNPIEAAHELSLFNEKFENKRKLIQDYCKEKFNAYTNYTSFHKSLKLFNNI